MSFQGHCVQAMLAAQRTQLSSAQLHTDQQLDRGMHRQTLETGPSSTLQRSIIISYTQKPFSFEKLGGLAKLFLFEQPPMKYIHGQD